MRIILVRQGPEDESRANSPAGMGRVILAQGRARLPLGLKDKPTD